MDFTWRIEWRSCLIFHLLGTGNWDFSFLPLRNFSSKRNEHSEFWKEIPWLAIKIISPNLLFYKGIWCRLVDSKTSKAKRGLYCCGHYPKTQKSQWLPRSSEDRKEIVSQIQIFLVWLVLSQLWGKIWNNLLDMNWYNSQGNNFQRAQLIQECTCKRALSEYHC